MAGSIPVVTAIASITSDGSVSFIEPASSEAWSEPSFNAVLDLYAILQNTKACHTVIK